MREGWIRSTVYAPASEVTHFHLCPIQVLGGESAQPVHTEGKGSQASETYLKTAVLSNPVGQGLGESEGTWWSR